MQQAEAGVTVSVSVDRPCVVRVEAAFGQTSSNSSSKGGRSAANASHYFAERGRARLRIADVPFDYRHGRHETVTLVAYASSTSEASSSTVIHVPVMLPPPRPSSTPIG